jgi:peptidoglycan/xylan/chitin deacetylase (PgdA/CDA1 family)
MLANLFILSTLSLAVNGQTSSVSAASSPSSAASSTTSVSGSSTGTATGNGTAAANGTSTHTGTQATALTFSLTATNPTAVPLSSITSNQASLPTIPLPSTASPGATNTFVSGAPALPNPTSIVSSKYPPWDKVPPTNSSEVQAWIQQVQQSGLQIPGFAPTQPGGCPTNPDAVADPSRCWWTCGGCVRSTDVDTCPDKNTWGLTYDDGPSFYTPNLLTYLNQVNLRATFFVVGSRAVQFPQTLQAEFLAGHQIAVHTWSHPPLTTLTNEEIIAELGWSKKVIQDVLGITPSYMRPPFGDIDDRVRNISMAMGLVPVMWTRMSATATFDTDDFDVAGGLASSYGVLNNWENIVGNASTIDTGFIVLEHDLFEESVELATGYILPSAMKQNFNIKPVVECLHLPMSDAYIETNDNKSNPPLVTQTIAAASAGTTGASSSSKNGGVTLEVPRASFALALSGVFAVAALFL